MRGSPSQNETMQSITLKCTPPRKVEGNRNPEEEESGEKAYLLR